MKEQEVLELFQTQSFMQAFDGMVLNIHTQWKPGIYCLYFPFHLTRGELLIPIDVYSK